MDSALLALYSQIRPMAMRLGARLARIADPPAGHRAVRKPPELSKRSPKGQATLYKLKYKKKPFGTSSPFAPA